MSARKPATKKPAPRKRKAAPAITEAMKASVLALRVQNATPAMIAEKLKLSPAALDAVLSELYADARKDDHEYELELSRIAMYERKLVTVAANDPASENGARAIDTQLRLWQRRREMRREKANEKREMDKWREARAASARMDLEIKQGKYLPRETVETQMRQLAQNVKRITTELNDRYGKDAAALMLGVMDRPNE